MAALAPEQEPKVGIGISTPVEQPSLNEIPKNPDADRILEGEGELREFIKPRDETASHVQGEKGETLLVATGIPTTSDLQLPEKELKPRQWYHFHKHAGDAITWIVETILRRDKMKAKE